MGIFLGERRLASTFPEPVIPPFRGAYSGSSSGQSVANRPDSALMVPAVWACVGLISNAVAMLPLEAYERNAGGIPSRVDDPPLLARPYADMTQGEWLHMLLVSLLMRGNAIGRIIERDSLQRPLQVQLLNPDTVRIEVDKDTGALKYSQFNAGVERELVLGDIWHVRGMTMPGARVGLSPISYAAGMLGVDLAARQFASDFFNGGGIPKAVLTTDKEVTEDQATRIKERLLQATRRREPTILGGGTAYQSISVNPEESQFLATHAQTVTEVARIFHVPAGMVGGSEGGSMCVDTETEMLTSTGWKRYDEIEQGDECLTINADTGLAEWQPVEAVYVFDGEHDVTTMRNGTHSSVTTTNHRWPVYQESKTEMSWRETRTLVSSDVILAAAPVANLPTEPKWSDAFVELVAWFYTEGWVGPHGETRIAQSQSVNPENCARIRAALGAVFGPEEQTLHVRSRPAWVAGVYNDRITHYRLNKLASAGLLAAAPGKVPTVEFLSQLTRAQLDLFISTSIDADGSVTAHGTPVLGQKDLRRLESFQVACLLAGKSGVIRQDASGRWFMAVQTTSRRKPMGRAEYVSTERRDIRVWCPTTPNRSWMARRDGTTYFTGNTYANVEQRSLDFLVHCIQPWLQRLEQAIGTLLPASRFVRFDVATLLRTDARTQAEVDNMKLAGKIIVPSEIRNRDGRPPMTAAQQAEADMVPLTITPGGTAKALPAMKLPPGPSALVPAGDQQQSQLNSAPSAPDLGRADMKEPPDAAS